MIVGWRNRGLKDQLGRFHRELSEETNRRRSCERYLLRHQPGRLERKIKIIFPFCGGEKESIEPASEAPRSTACLIRPSFHCRGKRLYYCDSHARIIARRSRKIANISIYFYDRSAPSFVHRRIKSTWTRHLAFIFFARSIEFTCHRHLSRDPRFEELEQKNSIF